MSAVPDVIRRRWLSAVCVAALLIVAGCGGGGGATPLQAAAETGSLTISVRDADGDFLGYAVDVTSLRLEDAGGDVVETLPRTSRVDFADLVELSEFLTARTVPASTYTRVTVGLDFSGAGIVVQDEAGIPRAAIAVDERGLPLARIDVGIELPNSEPIRIAGASPAFVTLDFDLEASNEIDWSRSPPQITVAPFLTVVAELERDREHRLRGLLAAVDRSARTVTLAVRPFRHDAGDFGRIRFATDLETHYEINGIEYAGTAGFAALADLPDGTPVVAEGPVADRLLTADLVLAGDSVPWADAQGVRGIVTARADRTLEVLGWVYDGPRRVFELRRRVFVEVGEGTHVTAPGLGIEVPGIDDVSVGSRIVASGRFEDADSLDASEGRIRLSMSQLTGTVLGVSPVAVDLHRLNGLRPAAFDFAGTGVSLADDSNPDAYEIATSTLGLEGIESGDLVRVRGRVTPFGLAPPDFHARTVVDVEQESSPALLVVGWPGRAQNPFVSMAPDRLDVDLTEARTGLTIRGVPAGDLADRSSVALLPGLAAPIYAARVPGSRDLRLFRSFRALVDALQSDLERGARMRKIVAGGRYNAGTAELSTSRASFELSAP